MSILGNRVARTEDESTHQPALAEGAVRYVGEPIGVDAVEPVAESVSA